MRTLPESRPGIEAASRRRRKRYRLLEELRSFSVRSGGHTCMWAMGSTVKVAGTASGNAHVSGVQRCSSAWACPVCAPTIGEGRATMIDALLSAHRAAGGEVFFISATLRHTKATKLGDALDVLQAAWSRTVRQGLNPHPWYEGQVRAIEVTHSDTNGWHPHIHAAILIGAGFDAERWAAAELVALGRMWKESCALLGYEARVTPVRDRLTGELVRPGWDVRRCSDASALARYITKVEGGWGAGLELARLDLKVGREGSRSPSQILEDAANGCRKSRELYRDYETATAGRHRVSTTAGLYARYGIADQTDDQLAEAALLETPEVEAFVPAEDWRRLLAAGFAAVLLDDVAALALDRRAGWPWPPEWLSTA